MVPGMDTPHASLGPLVPPGPPLRADERTRFARHLLLPGVGELGQRRLRAARVLLVGAGGLGSPAALYLAAAGVGTLVVVDDDVVDRTNLQRQILHGEADVGRAKVDSARDTIADLSPDTEVVTHARRLDPGSILDIIAEVDVVLDGADNFPTRALVSRACAALGIPHVWASVHRFDAQLSVWWPPAGPCYHCVFPAPPPAGLVPSCATGGVLGATVGAVGSVLATEVIKLITGLGHPLVGRLLVHDGLEQRWDAVAVERNPDCGVCGSTAPPGLVDLVSGGGAADAAGAREHPQAPTARPTITVRDLAALLEQDQPPRLLDVREPGEREIVTIPGATAWPIGDLRRGLDPPAGAGPVYVHCKSGARSAEAVDLLRARGVDARDVAGGVLAWVAEVDPSLPSY